MLFISLSLAYNRSESFYTKARKLKQLKLFLLEIYDLNRNLNLIRSLIFRSLENIQKIFKYQI